MYGLLRDGAILIVGLLVWTAGVSLFFAVLEEVLGTDSDAYSCSFSVGGKDCS